MLAIIQPEFVLCGGDLTDARARNDLVSEGQIVSEWEIYQEITDTRWNKVPWLDIRGNHDTYGVLSTSSSQNYFANYSVMGREGHLSSYSKKFLSRRQKFNVVAVDATIEPGLREPFDWVGHVNEERQAVLKDIVADIQEDEVAIFLGHYPTSVIKNSDYIRSLISRGLGMGFTYDIGTEEFNLGMLKLDKGCKISVIYYEDKVWIKS